MSPESQRIWARTICRILAGGVCANPGQFDDGPEAAGEAGGILPSAATLGKDADMATLQRMATDTHLIKFISFSLLNSHQGRKI